MERDQATELIHNLLRGMISKKASDLFITTGFPPAFKVDGKMTPVSNQVLTTQHTQELARSIMNDRQAAEFEATHECNFAISPHGIGRFRVNVFMQQQRVGMVLRTITTKIPDLDEMGMPPVLKDIVMTKRGLVILVGGTGSGKSTTLAGDARVIATRTATATSSPSKTRWSMCMNTSTASSRTARSAWIPIPGMPR